MPVLKFMMPLQQGHMISINHSSLLSVVVLISTATLKHGLLGANFQACMIVRSGNFVQKVMLSAWSFPVFRECGHFPSAAERLNQSI
jgi:hypothetical protein